MGVSLQKVAGSSRVLKVALSNKNLGKFKQNSGKQSISQFLLAGALLLQMLLEFTLQREAPMPSIVLPIFIGKHARALCTNYLYSLLVRCTKYILRIQRPNEAIEAEVSHSGVNEEINACLGKLFLPQVQPTSNYVCRFAIRVPGWPSDLNTGNGTEGAMVCTSLGSLLRPLFYFLCSNLKANPVDMLVEVLSLIAEHPQYFTWEPNAARCIRIHIVQATFDRRMNGAPCTDDGGADGIESVGVGPRFGDGEKQCNRIIQQTVEAAVATAAAVDDEAQFRLHLELGHHKVRE